MLPVAMLPIADEKLRDETEAVTQRDAIAELSVFARGKPRIESPDFLGYAPENYHAAPDRDKPMTGR